MRVRVLVAAAAASCSAAMAQNPPMKMGLWETVSVTTTQMPPAMADKMKAAGIASGMPTTSTDKSCITIDSWQQSLAHMNNPREGCTYTDKTITSQGMTFAMSCVRRSMTTTMKGTVAFESADVMKSDVHIEMAMPASAGGGGSIVTQTKGTARFVSTDCGNVKPFSERQSQR